MSPTGPDARSISPAAVRIPSLDGLRGIAVLAVMASHFPYTPTSGLERMAARLSMPGQTGVDLFFVLSGFLITGILLDSKAGAHALSTFYLRRLLRIFPLYYATLTTLFIVTPLLTRTPVPAAREQLWFWLYLQNIGFAFVQAPGPNHLWSLAVEEQFYLVWPVVVLYSERPTIVRWLAWGIVVALVSRVILIAAGYKSFYFTLCRIDGLALGAMLAVYCRAPGGFTALYAWARRILVLAPVPLVGAYVIASGSSLVLLQVTKNTLISAVFAALLVVVLGGSPGSLLVRFCTATPLRSTGKYSYALYLFHPFVFSAVSSATSGRPLALRVFAAFVATYAAALVSWQVLEWPFLQLKERLEYRPLAPPRPALPAT